MQEIADDASFVPGLLQEMRRNFFTHVTKDVAFRKEQIKRLIQGHEEMKGELDEALKKDLGYTPFLSFFLSHNITKNEMQHTLDHFEQWVKPTSISLPIVVGMGSSYVQPEPLGVTLVLGAWNYPTYLTLPFTAVAIAAGNCVVVKPSEFAPNCSHVIKKLYDRYLDPRFYRCVEGKVEVGRALTSSKFDLILFTGSTQIGTMVAQAAAKNLVPCVLELGGKCPVIVDSSANLTGAAKRIVMGRYMNCGQTCIAADHLFVHNSIKKQFLEILVATLKELYGDNVSSCVDMGKIINSAHVQRLEKYLKEEHGGKVIVGGKVFPENQFVQPTIVDEPKEDCGMMRDEIFGPILPVFGYDELDSVIEKINSRPKPLTVYVFTENKAVKDRVRVETSAGAFVVNDVAIHLINPELPFGGVGMSGYGRYHGKCGFDACSNPKSVVDAKIMDSWPVSLRFPPYTPQKEVTPSLNIVVADIHDDQDGQAQSQADHEVGFHHPRRHRAVHSSPQIPERNCRAAMIIE